MIENLLNPLLPKTFDENELFTIFISILVLVFFLILHLRYRALRYIEMFSLFLFNLLLITIVESTLAEPPIDLYDTLDYAYAELFDIVLQVIVYPIQMMILIYTLAIKEMNLFKFIIICAIILTVLELISLQFNLFEFKKWNSMYSLLFYCLAVSVNVMYFKKIRQVIVNMINQT
jgi:hypothetical protein